jgi:hypothetical protein
MPLRVRVQVVVVLRSITPYGYSYLGAFQVVVEELMVRGTTVYSLRSTRTEHVTTRFTSAERAIKSSTSTCTLTRVVVQVLVENSRLRSIPYMYRASYLQSK